MSIQPLMFMCFGFWQAKNVISDFLSFMILYNYIIPISLYVTVGKYKHIQQFNLLHVVKYVLNFTLHVPQIWTMI